jgi:hypothetical protein
MACPCGLTASARSGSAFSTGAPCPASDSTICGTHATHLLASGVHPKVASERLGHSKVGITLDLYSHVLPNMQTDAAALVDDALKVAVQKRSGKGIG